MSAELTADILEDDLAVSLAQGLAVANKRAGELGFDVSRSLITVTRLMDDGIRWRINYGPADYISRRGGDLIVEVSGREIKQVLQGQ